MRLRSILLRTILLVTLALAGAHFKGAAAFAQEPQASAAAHAPLADTPLDQAAKEIDKAKVQLTALQDGVKQNADNDDALVGLATTADELSRAVITISVNLRPRFDQIKNRLAEIGEPPKDGQPPEAAIVTQERNALAAERAQINAVTGDAENLSITVTKLVNEIIEMRRRLFADTLFRRTEISVSVLDDAASAFVHEVSEFSQALSSWAVFVWKFKRFPLFAAIFLSLASALILLSGSYRLFGSYLRRDEAVENPSYIGRLSIAFWSTLIRTLALSVLLVTSFFFLNGFNVLRPDIAPVIGALFAAIGLVYFVGRFVNAIFAPNEPRWRLVHLSNLGARSIGYCLLAMAIVNALDYLFSTVSEAMGSPLVLTVVRSLIAALIIGIILISASFGKPMLAKNGDPDAPGRHWPRGMAIILRVLGAGLIIAALTGYVGLARFVATQLIITGAVVVTMYVGLLSGKAISKQESFGDTFFARFLTRRFNLGPVAIDQAGLVVGLAIYAVALVVGLPLILLLWGFHIQDLQLIAYRLFTEVRLGGISISLLGICTGILLFAGVYLLTRWLQRWLDGNVMARSHVDLGVRNSVKTGIGYLGVGIAAIIGVSAAGIDLSSFALVASALSVGIGFGLQNIVSNFVSGLILLVERPFKVGDHVVSGTAEGIVKRISVRATEIETFRKQSIIVPNSELINGLVGNWTHRNKIGRSEIPVSVSYNADPQQVMDILLELTAKIPLVMRNPEPHVEFLRFGPYSLDFELRFFLADMGDGMTVRNNLRIEILRRFKAEGIEIPLPQSDLTIHRDAAPLPANARKDQADGQETPRDKPMEDEERPVRQLRGRTAEGGLKS
ncbi:mechanosensitive ion channel family protein [Rhizobium hidalgonense]|uniref:Mechanosensitive ion channel family protein n=1 Tax=Rhizobium hidalgonense TaxID=1538159 RepID=A0A2A6KKW9_9HYPH|nr:mechanosensitive ion channel family protein [Rhizobium hidalgonense]MDR9771553.1 mechanosensitive ion channel family protein [Rhizobium hidalgonense]MDR9808877.1 mechanosensitive ion channel family protein [Rhizobium hidalgonense]MDR9818416.1 mechanosensitive ion channel family protein [Rhizobium hidalgonense]PDT25527.1 mechanosensitive ion channel protein [Rhizobium hidalgonense]PON07662.1 mechanosensitive ion channel protein [Rhizobium hidalgonense]